MTILVFTSGILTIATETWAATELRDAAKPLVQVHVLGSPAKAQCNLTMDMAEFLALIADGGRMVDLRGLQGISAERRQADLQRVMEYLKPGCTKVHIAIGADLDNLASQWGLKRRWEAYVPDDLKEEPGVPPMRLESDATLRARLVAEIRAWCA